MGERKGEIMKIKIKVDELINILIQKHEGSLLRKYNLNKEKVTRLQKSLQNGNWRIVS